MEQWTLIHLSQWVFDHKWLHVHQITLFLMQGELEHCLPKSRYTHTNHKSFVKQLTVIERRQTHIHRIRAMNKLRSRTTESTIVNPEEHHFIGKLQNFPVNIPTFLRENQGDPAIRVRKGHWRLIHFRWIEFLPQCFRTSCSSWKVTSFLVWKLF